MQGISIAIATTASLYQHFSDSAVSGSREPDLSGAAACCREPRHLRDSPADAAARYVCVALLEGLALIDSSNIASKGPHQQLMRREIQ